MRRIFWAFLIFMVLLVASFLILFKLKFREPVLSEKPIFGGIIPHDSSVEYMNIELLKKLALQKPKLVFLFGPNHFEKGNNKITVFEGDWQTSIYGKVKTDKDFVDSLVEKGLAGVNNDIFSNEHSIGNNMDYFYLYLPETKVVPIIFKKNCSLGELRALSEYIATKTNKDAIVLTSVDFSHYLSYPEAKEMDEITIAEMKKFNYDGILGFDSKNLDSPASIVTLLMLAQKESRTNMEILHYINSAQLKRSEAAPTTSYFSIIFY